MIKAVFFDVANTLLHKPELYDRIGAVLSAEGWAIERRELEVGHKLLSESIRFPDKTSRGFYNEFNGLLLTRLGITPSERLLARIFDECTYLPWAVFPDVDSILNLDLPFGIVSNWDLSLPRHLTLIRRRFDWVLGSEECGMRKPDEGFFHLIVKKTGLAADSILVVGDSLKLDIYPARNVGMKAVLIDRLNIYENETSRISSLSELGRVISADNGKP